MSRTFGRRAMAMMTVAGAAPLLLIGCSKSDETSTTASSTTPASVAANVNQGPTIELRNRSFQPADATAKVGQTVKWSNMDEGVAHTVTESKPEGAKIIESPKIQFEQEYTLSFTTPGTYKYECSIHPSTMKGTITVEA